MVVLLAHTDARACSPATTSWSLPGDGATDVPTNTLIYADSVYTLARADGESVVETTEIETWSSWDIDGFQPVVLQPTEPLDPDTRYVLLGGGFRFAAFRTAPGADEEAPEPPSVTSIEATTGYDMGSCDAARFVAFALYGDGALLLIDPNADEDRSRVDEDVFGTCCVYAERFHGSTATYAVERRSAGDAYRFGAIDQAGNWSGWGPVVDAGRCGCGTGPAGSLVALAMAAGCARRPRGPVARDSTPRAG
jgi:hypothetical protein